MESLRVDVFLTIASDVQLEHTKMALKWYNFM